jgi:acyl carrier protein phosphodiesterase
VNTVRGQSELKTFYSKDDLPGIAMRINATAETVPGSNMTIVTWVNCTATGVLVEQLNMTIYGFVGGTNKTQLATIDVMENKTLTFNSVNETSYTFTVPSDVWDTTYADLHLRYFIYNSGFEHNPSFSLTIVRNIYYEQLKEDFKDLNDSFIQLNSTLRQLNYNYSQLNANYSQLNEAYNELNSVYSELNGNYSQLKNTYDQLSQAYSDLQLNFTQLQGSVTDLDNTRRLAAVLGVTSVFFVVTTVYLVTRRPKESW